MKLRDRILAPRPRRREPIDLPELADVLGGERLYVWEMKGTERDEYEAGLVTFSPDGKRRETNLANVRAKIACKCLVTEAGERVFTDADAEAVGELGAAALDRIYEAAARLSGMRRGDEEEAKNASLPTPASA
ncbi:MAG TPA: hypothetical protein VMS17_16685 [Gemmataceae bacterium]|nr:hypothetical protein [Gemmataceae bacterium]